MTPESEKQLIDADQKRVASALETLLNAHSFLIRSAAYKMHMPQCYMEELMQAGYVGLIQAVDRYNPAENCRLSTFALPWILGEMKKTIGKLLAGGKMVLSLDFPCDQTASDSELAEITGYDAIDFERMDLRIALENLPLNERKLLMLRYFMDKTQKETAAVLNKSQTQISRQENRLLHILRTRLS